MKPRFFHSSFWTLASSVVLLAATSFQTSALAQTPVFEAGFNDASSMDLQYGATLGPGVSGLPDDKSYTADVANVAAGQKSPMALTTVASPATGIDEFTITVWFKPRQSPQNDATLFDLLGTVFMWEDKSSQWVLRVDTKPPGETKPSQYWFRTGGTAPLGAWSVTNEWCFVAMVWKKSDKKVTFYQAGNTTPLAVAKEVSRTDDVASLDERASGMRIIGNNAGTQQRPFDGSIDDFRYYTEALSADSIEKIRLADLKNRPPVLP